VKIDNYRAFKAAIVETDFQEFMAEKGSLRKAWHCAGSLFHLHDWVYQAQAKAIKAKFKFINDKKQKQRVSNASHFANSLGQAHADFELIRGIANASKHFVLRTPPPARLRPRGMPSHAANVYVTSVTFQPGAFQPSAFQTQGDVMLQAQPKDIAFADLARSVKGMWDQLFVSEGG
jgi:hypothetical protein